jgi:hypothetical protein
MEAQSVTVIWMAGVVGMMVVFGVIAIVGILRNPAEHKPEVSRHD